MSVKQRKGAAAPCWNLIGVWSESGPSCPTLKEIVHCRNCEVFASHGRSLLDSKPPEGYLGDWLEHIAVEREEEDGETESALVFRLEDEWLAIRTTAFKGVHPVCAVHMIPHRSDEVFLGMANIDGMLELCFSLKALFGIRSSAPEDAPRARSRFLVLERSSQRWVFGADEIAGIVRRRLKNASNVPVTVSSSSANFTRCVFNSEGRAIGLLDEELLISALRRRIS